MADQPKTSAAEYLPKKRSYPALLAAAEGCRGCELYKYATQTVFGMGARRAPLMLVGEQPGDEEDIQGLPFVGPAGKLLDRALAEAGIPRKQVYVTNAVKHFRFVERGKKRIHHPPAARHISACRRWLLAEIEVIRPKLVLCLGATAAKSFFGGGFALSRHRGEWLDGPGDTKILSTYHPSAVLRAPDHDTRDELYRAIVKDLKRAARRLAAGGEVG